VGPGEVMADRGEVLVTTDKPTQADLIQQALKWTEKRQRQTGTGAGFPIECRLEVWREVTAYLRRLERRAR